MSFDFEKVKKDSLRHAVFNSWQGMGIRVETLGHIAQNEMPIDREMIENWIKLSKKIHKEYTENFSETLKWLKDQL